MITRKRSKRKDNGGLYKDFRKKRKSELGRNPTMTRIGKNKVREERVLGGNIKSKIIEAEDITICDKGKCQKAKIKRVVENPANRNLVRQNILTKGAVVETDKGKVKVTSRPGQTSVVSGVLVKE